jgi:hypothetical protein
VVDEGLLKNRQLAVLRAPPHRADRPAVETRGGDDTGRAGVARSVRIIDDHRTAQALRSETGERCSAHFPRFGALRSPASQLAALESKGSDSTRLSRRDRTLDIRTTVVQNQLVPSKRVPASSALAVNSGGVRWRLRIVRIGALPTLDQAGA